MGFKNPRVAVTLVFTIGLAGCGLVSNSSSNSKSSAPVKSIALSPQNSAVTIGQTLQLKAMATLSDGTQMDISSTATWNSSSPTVATVSAGKVSGVALGVVTIQVADGSANAATLLNVTFKNFSNASLNGTYAFNLTGGSTKGLRFEAGSITADGKGNITGIEDVNAVGVVAAGTLLTGTYSIAPDGRGSLTLDTTGQPSRTFRFVLSSNSSMPGDNNGTIIEFDAAATATGTLEKQDASSFQNASLGNGTYVFRVGGLDSAGNSISTVGMFTIDASGATITGGTEDVNDNGTINNGSASTISITGGTIGAVDTSTGRAAATLSAGGATTTLEFLVVSSNKIEIIGSDSALEIIGTAERQASPAPGTIGPGGYVFLTKIGGITGQFWIMGQFQVDNASHVIGLTQNQVGGIVLNIVAPAGTITTAANGRGTLQENTTDGVRNFTFYMVSSSRLFLLGTDDSHAASGAGEMQQPGQSGFGAGTLNNAFGFGAAEIGDQNVAMVAEVVADGAGNLVGIEDVSQPTPGNPSTITVSTLPLAANYTQVITNGLITATVSTAGNAVQGMAIYLVSPDKALLLGLSPTSVNGTMIVQ